jgi:hypothetical protein
MSYATVLSSSRGLSASGMVSDFRVSDGSASYSAERHVEGVTVVELDAAELHRRMLGLHRLSNQVRLQFLRTLAVFDAGERYTELGYPSSRAYLISALDMSRSNAKISVRVARRLGDLPKLAAALGESELSWSGLREVSLVATTDSEQQWIDYAQEHTPEEQVHEVKVARQEGRDVPKESSEFGLQNLRTTILLEVSLEEKLRIETAMRKVARSMGDGAPTDLTSVMLFLSQQILEDQVPAVRLQKFRSKQIPPTQGGTL